MDQVMRFVVVLAFLTFGCVGLFKPRAVQRFYVREYSKWPNTRRGDRQIERMERSSFVVLLRVSAALCLASGIVLASAVLRGQ
jgi:hypothetical protein